ncbi:LacI family DNA-binding transcriptional regulator [Pseudarthrobacter sp. N5]|uniref:LacI family DNA-binding transcriptional regulator n=1 Tax=Pseudarthrobacter sp. N5 TaxID=3418416 RepID=UPI003CF046F9
MTTARKSKPADSKATIYDIAKLAGVNASTVSRALGKPGRVSTKTQKLVEDAAAQLNYTVNPFARALPTGRTNTFGLIVSDITNPIYFDVIRGAEAAAAASGFTMILAESAESAETEFTVATRMAPATDGIVLASPRMPDPQIRELSAFKPVVVINRLVDEVASVVPDVGPGLGEAVRHLAANGHRRLVFLAGPQRSWMAGRRWESFRAACEWSRLESVSVPTKSPTLDGGRQAARDVIASGATAALCYNDLLAIGLMQELQAAGINIPDEFSVVGFDNIFGSDFTTPQLSSIASPLLECGAVALEQLLAISRGPGSGHRPGGLAGSGVPGARPLVLSTRLVVRGSSGRLVTALT